MSGMPVLDEAGTVIGIVSEADVIGKRGATVGEIMTPEVVVVAQATPIERIAALMAEKKIKRVPVDRRRRPGRHGQPRRHRPCPRRAGLIGRRPPCNCGQ